MQEQEPTVQMEVPDGAGAAAKVRHAVVAMLADWACTTPPGCTTPAWWSANWSPTRSDMAADA